MLGLQPLCNRCSSFSLNIEPLDDASEMISKKILFSSRKPWIVSPPPLVQRILPFCFFDRCYRCRCRLHRLRNLFSSSSSIFALLSVIIVATIVIVVIVFLSFLFLEERARLSKTILPVILLVCIYSIIVHIWYYYIYLIFDIRWSRDYNIRKRPRIYAKIENDYIYFGIGRIALRIILFFIHHRLSIRWLKKRDRFSFHRRIRTRPAQINKEYYTCEHQQRCFLTHISISLFLSSYRSTQG